MGNNTAAVAMDRRLAPQLAADLCETLFFGAAMFLDSPSLVAETGDY